MRVRIYWNLTKKVWSVQDAKTRRVIGHATRVNVRDASFKVSQAGRERVLREGVKNVHAFVVGDLDAAHWIETRDHPGTLMSWTRGDNAYLRAAVRLGKRVSYNPRKASVFFDVYDDRAVFDAPMVCLDARTVLAFDPCEMTEAESLAATY